MRLIILIILGCILSLVEGKGQERKLLIEDVTVIPLHINQVFEHRDVIIVDGVIAQIRTHQEKDTSKYTLGRVDGSGKFLIPSFADAHVHLPEKTDLHHYFLMNLINGVTTLRSMRGEDWHLEIEDAEWRPQLLLSTPPITRRDSMTKVEVQSLIKGYKDQGFDFVKILSVKNAETFNHLVRETTNYGLPLAGHCPRNIGIFNVCQSKVYNSIEHLGGFFQLTEKTDIDKAINLSITNSVYHCPTLDWYYTGQVNEDSLRMRNGVHYLPPKLIAEWEKKIQSYYNESTEQERIEDRLKSKRQFNTRLSYLGYIYRNGGKLLLSPDASGIYSVPGFGIHTEMSHYSKAGISNYDILKSACYNLSEMLHSENDWGTIKIGAKSDLVLLNENPLDDISNTEKIQGLVFKGKYYSRKKLELLLNKDKK